MCERQILAKSRNRFDDLNFEELLGPKFSASLDCIGKNKTLYRKELMSEVFNSENMDAVFAEDDEKGSDYFRLKRIKYYYEKFNITLYSEK